MNLQFAILGMLTITSMNGYTLKKIFDKSINYFWTASLSQIYRELAVLEKKGFVTSTVEEQDDRPDKRVYSITSTGTQAFRTWLADFPEKIAVPGRDEFLLRLFFGSQLGKAELIRQFERYLRQREERVKQMIEDKKIITELTKKLDKTASPEQELCMRLITRRTQLANESLIQWAKECIQELENSDF